MFYAHQLQTQVLNNTYLALTEFHEKERLLLDDCVALDAKQSRIAQKARAHNISHVCIM